MDIQAWTYLIVGITFAIYIGIAIWARAGSTKEFYVASGGVHPLAIALVVSTLTVKPPAHIQELVENIRHPS
jgi:Na+/proline symporter